MTLYQDDNVFHVINHLKTFKDHCAGDLKRCPKYPVVIITKILPLYFVFILFRDFRIKLQVQRFLQMVNRSKNME